MGRLLCYARNSVFLLFMGLGFNLQAQDPIMSQFTFNEPYLNPAYAGSSRDLSFAAQSRMLWTGVPGAFRTNFFNMNIGCPTTRLGFGIQAYNHTEGEGSLKTSQVTGQTSVNIPGKLPRYWGRLRNYSYILSAGLQLGIGQKYVDWSKLTFSDQFSHFTGFANNPSLVVPTTPESNVIMDISGGLRWKMELNNDGAYLSAGAAIFHVNRPVETFWGVDSRRPPRYSMHGFVYIPNKRYTNYPDHYSIGLIFNSQASLNSTTLLVYKDFETYMKAGLGMRRQNFIPNNTRVDALIVQVMFNKNSFIFGYSFDATVSQLSAHRTYGTHEIGIKYTIDGLTLCNQGRSRGKGRSFGSKNPNRPLKKGSKYGSTDCFRLNAQRGRKDYIGWNL